VLSLSDGLDELLEEDIFEVALDEEALVFEALALEVPLLPILPGAVVLLLEEILGAVAVAALVVLFGAFLDVLLFVVPLEEILGEAADAALVVLLEEEPALVVLFVFEEIFGEAAEAALVLFFGAEALFPVLLDEILGEEADAALVVLLEADFSADCVEPFVELFVLPFIINWFY